MNQNLRFAPSVDLFDFEPQPIGHKSWARGYGVLTHLNHRFGSKREADR